jgi:hypothetical protein
LTKTGHLNRDHALGRGAPFWIMSYLLVRPRPTNILVVAERYPGPHDQADQGQISQDLQ